MNALALVLIVTGLWIACGILAGGIVFCVGIIRGIREHLLANSLKLILLGPIGLSLIVWLWVRELVMLVCVILVYLRFLYDERFG